MNDKESTFEIENKSLKARNEALNEEIRSIKLENDEHHTREKQELRKQIIDLEKELEDAETEIKERDLEYRDNIQ